MTPSCPRRRRPSGRRGASDRCLTRVCQHSWVYPTPPVCRNWTLQWWVYPWILEYLIAAEHDLDLVRCAASNESGPFIRHCAAFRKAWYARLTSATYRFGAATAWSNRCRTSKSTIEL